MWHVCGRGEVHSAVSWRNPNERDHMKNLGLDGIKLLKLIFKEQVVRSWTGFIWPRIGVSGVSFYHDSEPSVSIKYVELLTR
jgi:hypothetical protein